jgi:hypothetical protein
LKNYLLKIVFASLFGLPFFSCTERIDIKLDSSYVRLVVEGSITTDTMAHTVVLTKSTSYYFTEEPPAVTGAVVSISCGGIRYNLKEEKPGVYRTDSTVYGVTGKVYTLNIKLAADLGGYIDYSASATLYEVNPLDSVKLLYHPDWSESGLWEVSSFFQDPPTKDYYRFTIFRNSKIITDTLSEWFVTDDMFLEGKYAFGAPVGFLDQSYKDEILNTGDTIMVEMNSIGREYAEFLYDAQSEIMGSNPLFSGPPANVKGNINNGAIGFFAVYSISRAVTITP